ncbi:MAG: hypothetical protein ABI054_06920, partial [Planctomycetota bacterium]
TAFATLASAKSSALPQIHADDSGLAPDGKRGFGLALKQKGVSELFRSNDPEDRAFFDELTEVSNATRALLLNLRQHYVDRGYFQLLPGSAGDDMAALHAAYAKSWDMPARELAPGDARARALAAMLVDTRFNVRRELVSRAEVAVLDLERARAVFSGTVNGFVMLSEAEIEHIAARADLASAELRALRSDLEVLKPGPDDKGAGAEETQLTRKLLEIGRIADEKSRASELAALLEPRRALEARMQLLLFSARVEPKLAPLRQWRDRVVKSAADIRARVLELIPGTTEGEAAQPEIARMKKTDRLNQGATLAVQGLVNDPLDPDLAWAAGHARYIFVPDLVAVTYFDRYLVLSGIRTGDPIPGNGRKFTPREQEAFDAVVSFQR